MLTCTILLTACSIPLSVVVDNTCSVGQIKAEKTTKIWLKSLYDPETKKPISLQHVTSTGRIIDMTTPDSFKILLERIGRTNQKVEEFCNVTG